MRLNYFALINYFKYFTFLAEKGNAFCVLYISIFISSNSFFYHLCDRF